MDRMAKGGTPKGHVPSKNGAKHDANVSKAANSKGGKGSLGKHGGKGDGKK